MQYKFYLNNLRIAPRKVRLITGLIKKMPVEEAEAQLKFQSKRTALPILKLLKSAVASAIHNFNSVAENLYVFNIFVDEGPKLKRFRPRAFGRAGAIHKKTSHVTLILEEKITGKIKKVKRSKKSSIVKTAKIEEKEEKKELPITQKREAVREIKPRGRLEKFTRRLFRRKAIG